MDSALPSKAWPGLTTDELRQRVADWEAISPAARAATLPANGVDVYERMKAEIERREAVAAGDTTRMTLYERLRWIRRPEGT